MTNKIKVSKAAKEFDYGDIPNPLRDRGKTGYRGSLKLLNPKKKKEYDALKKQIAFGDIEYEMFNRDKEKYEKVKDNKKIPDIQPFKKGGKISSGSIFVAKQYGGRIGK